MRLDVRGVEGEALLHALEPAVAQLEADRLMALPTATVYGLSGAATPAAVERLARLKGREAGGPFLLLVPDDDPLDGVVWTEAARALAGAFWPGPLTLILRAAGSELPPAVRSGAGGVAVRRSAHPVVRALLARFGRPVTSTSANRPGGAPARDAEACEAVWRALGGAAGDGMVVDAGPLPPGPPSTIVDCLDPIPRIRREGAIPLARLQSVVRDLVSNPELK